MPDEAVQSRPLTSINRRIRNKVVDEARDAGIVTDVADHDLWKLQGIYIRVVKETFTEALRESGYIEDDDPPEAEIDGSSAKSAYGA